MGRKNIAEKRFEREQEFESQFFSCEKDTKTIVEKLFINTQPYSDYLKRLLLINTKDCLDNKINPDYVKKIQNTQVKDLVEIDEKTAKIIKKFMPGPLTLVLKKKNNSEIPSYFDLNSGYIGIRIPDDKFILSLIDLVDCPLLVPSANKSNEKWKSI